MANLFDFAKSNISYYTLPAAFTLIMMPALYANKLAGKNMDFANPRKTPENCAKDTTMSKETLSRIVRAKNAAANGFETLGFFGAGVVAANAAGVVVNRVNALSVGYLVSRVLYNFVYVFLQDNARYAPVRTLVWLAGVGMSSALWILAGNKVA